MAGTGAGASQKVRGPVVVKEGEREGEGEGEDKGESEGEDEGESEGGSADGKGEDEDEGRNNEPRGKYSKRKIVDNSWRYEEPEEDPYLKGLLRSLSFVPPHPPPPWFTLPFSFSSQLTTP